MNICQTFAHEFEERIKELTSQIYGLENITSQIEDVFIAKRGEPEFYNLLVIKLQQARNRIHQRIKACLDGLRRLHFKYKNQIRGMPDDVRDVCLGVLYETETDLVMMTDTYELYRNSKVDLKTFIETLPIDKKYVDSDYLNILT
jgi:uncharacterized protein (DUF885 family)